MLDKDEDATFSAADVVRLLTHFLHLQSLLKHDNVLTDIIFCVSGSGSRG